MKWWYWAPSAAVAAYICIAIIGSLIRRRNLDRRMAKVRAEMGQIHDELAALVALTPDDYAWLAQYGAMTNAMPLPAVGSTWEWDLGDPHGREVITVLETTSAPAAVLISRPSGSRWVPLTDFQVYAAAPPLKGKHR